MSKKRNASKPIADDLQDTAATLAQIEDDLREEGLLIAAQHIADAIEDIDEHVSHLEQLRDKAAKGGGR